MGNVARGLVPRWGRGGATRHTINGIPGPLFIFLCGFGKAMVIPAPGDL